MKLEASIQSERLILRSLVKEDIGPWYVDWLNDPEVTQFLESRFAKHDTESVQNFVADINEGPASILLGIFLKNDDTHIGNIKIGPIDTHHAHATIGLMLGVKECWGRGFGTEAIAAATDFGIKSLGLKKLLAGCYSENEGSKRAFLKAGYIEEGRIKSYWLVDGKYQDEILLGYTRD